MRGGHFRTVTSAWIMKSKAWAKPKTIEFISRNYIFSLRSSHIIAPFGCNQMETRVKTPFSVHDLSGRQDL